MYYFLKSVYKYVSSSISLLFLFISVTGSILVSPFHILHPFLFISIYRYILVSTFHIVPIHFNVNLPYLYLISIPSLFLSISIVHTHSCISLPFTYYSFLYHVNKLVSPYPIPFYIHTHSCISLPCTSDSFLYHVNKLASPFHIYVFILSTCIYIFLLN